MSMYNITHSSPLPKPLRTQLENTVKSARDLAEQAARAALAQLAVGEAKAPDYLTDDLKALRRRLRAHGRALGDKKAGDDTQGLQHLIWEVAYEHWHRMLFARFLAENGLLLWEPGAPVSLDDCRDLVDHHPELALDAKSQWELAGRLAARMLPQVFKPHSPVFALTFAPEHQRALERLLADLPTEVFRASDSLGWVYQFWQAKRKDEVNASEVKIGADELPAVTQLFTEPYMVDFLLHNSLGAWWVTRHPDQPCPVPLPYLRTVPSPSPLAGEGRGEGDQIPAAGRFEGWPDTLADFKLLDPCCGSGHFLVAAFLLLVPMRMAAEGLSAREAVDAVLADNLHGLELDARCVEIAVFALALAAWRFPDEHGDPLGVRADMPAPNIACCGLKVAASAKDWEALVPDSQPNAALLRQELRLLHAAFAQAPLLGSLLDPARSLKDDLFKSSFDDLKDLLELALANETPATPRGTGQELNDDAWDLALTARGLLDAARLLDGRYHLVITNVPYLARGKQSDTLKDYCAKHYPEAKNDLANVFLERCLELCLVEAASSRLPAGGDQEPGRETRLEGASTGVVQIVMPQNWLFLGSYRKQRESLLRRVQWNLLVRLGEGGFDSPQAAGAFIILLSQTNAPMDDGFQLRGVDASEPKGAVDKAALLRNGELLAVSQKGQLGNPDARISLDEGSSGPLLDVLCTNHQGLSTGDNPRFRREHWEVPEFSDAWEPEQSTVLETSPYAGRSGILLWEGGRGQLYRFGRENVEALHNVDRRGEEAWGRKGVAVSQMRELPVTIYTGQKFDTNVAIVLPVKIEHLRAVWSFCSSPEYTEAVRRIDQKLNVTNATLVKVPFDLPRWQQVAAERYPNGLPKPYSDDPTQWLFHGHPQPATDPLQVAVARLLGYRWPAEVEAASSRFFPEGDEVAGEDTRLEGASTRASTAMELSDEARAWIARCQRLEAAATTDDDGIVCLSSVRGEPPAQDRLLALLIAAWETVEPGSWKPSILAKLLADADCAGKDLEVWLRDKFFEQHARRFQHRPFIWHVWDGLKDGFGALVNYHKLDARNLERLIHTYLGDWTRQQEAGVRDAVDGAQTRLAAAQDLKRRLELILEGEFDGKVGYDIFVRWKPLAEQPIGWNPDLNDGVRLNIRPFMTAGVLRHNRRPKLNIGWDKDRGKDVASAPWFGVFKGERINDHHLTLAEKAAARGKSS